MQKWKTADEYFVKTRASDHVMSCIRRNNCVSIVGPSGVGKTFLLQHVALEMEKIGYTIISVNGPHEIIEHYKMNRKTLFVIDDICGNFTAKTIRLDEWKNTMKDITYIIEGSCKLMLTCRLQVFQDEGFEHSDLSLFKSCVCNLIEKQLALTYLDKEQLAKMYFKNTYTNPQLRLDIRCLYQYNFFPLLCKLYDSQKDQSNFCMERFVKTPFTHYEKELDNLFVDCKKGKYKFIALLLLVVYNNHLDKNMIKEKSAAIKKLLSDIREQCGILDFLTVKSLISELDTMTGTFVLNEQDVYHTIHDKLFDLLALYFGTKNDVTKIEFTELLITHADKNFIGERFAISNTGLSDKEEFQYIITIQDTYLPLYIERVFDDMTKSDDIEKYMKNNRNKFNYIFLLRLSTFMKKIGKNKKESLIKNASVAFLRDVFVMNELNINTSPAKHEELYTWKSCRIILDYDLVQKYIPRIFNGMTESHYVTDYIERCRCCKNKVFHDALLTYMTNLKPSSVRDLIKNASTSFVQRMFVISKEYIDLENPSLYKRYGIEIPCDLIPLYIEKVFDGIEMCISVDMHIRQNRNRDNALFKDKLCAYMSHLDGSKIQKFIENSSQDCIDALCITNDDSKEKSQLENECVASIAPRRYSKMYTYQTSRSKLKNAKIQEDTKVTHFTEVSVIETIWDIKRYGIFIPTDYMPLYIHRWFDGMKKSKDIEYYINRNRNKETTQFQTALLNFMANLEEEEIKALIQTSTNNFLHTVLVTTGDHIRYDMFSRKMYQRYGIVIPKQYLEMYTFRILSLTERPECFIRDMAGNRSQGTVLKYMRQLDISKIAELIETAKADLFHRMITVEVEEELRLEREIVDCSFFVYDEETKLETIDGYITCPLSLVDKYMDRMILDWGEGLFDFVIQNINLKNKSFVQLFFAHLKTLEATTKSELLLIRNYRNTNEHERDKTALTISCKKGDINLATWCLKNYLFEHPQEEHCILCALFLLVVSNNKLEASNVIDESAILQKVRLIFKDKHNNLEAMSAGSIKEKLDSSLNGIVVKKEGVYSVRHSGVFKFLVFYFSSYDNATNILLKNAGGKFLCEQFLTEKTNPQHFLINRDVKQSQMCTERVFDEMTKSDHLLRYVLKRDNNLDMKPIFEYMKNVNKVKINTTIENSCIDFFNNFLVLKNDETKHDNDDEIGPYITVPDHFIPVYINHFFELAAKSNCVAGCLQENRNRNNITFINRLSIYMKALNKHDVENLIKNSSSDFISRMLVISKVDIKAKSYWEYECYGIVIPDDLLQMYTERVFNDFTECDCVYVNRNSGNRIFCDLLHSHASSMCGDITSTLIQAGSSTFIRHMNLSTEGNTTNSDRTENYFLFLLPKYYKIFKQQWPKGQKTKEIDKTVYISNVIEDDVRYFTLVSRRVGDYKRVRITVNKYNKQIINDEQCRATRYIDPILTSNRIEYCVITPESVVDKYMQRMTADWMKGKVHDVFANINLKCHSFLCKFLTHLKSIDNASQRKLAKTPDTITGDPPLTVCCYVGISQLVEWCLDNFGCADDLGEQCEREFSLYIACRQNDPDVVLILLKHENGPGVNTMSKVYEYKQMYEIKSSLHNQIRLQLFEVERRGGCWAYEIFEAPLFIACKYGHTEIVSILLAHKAHEIDINQNRVLSEFMKPKDTMTPLYIACKGGHANIVSVLLNHGVDVNKQTRDLETPLFAACENGHTDIVSLLLEKSDKGLNINRFDGTTPLFAACREGHIEVVLTLLKYEGIDVDKGMRTGMSPLFIASFLGHTEIVEILLSRNADLHQCVQNQTFLNAYFSSFVNCFEYSGKEIYSIEIFIQYIRKFISYKASESVKSYMDKMDDSWVLNLVALAYPLNIASAMGHTDIVKLLVKHTCNIEGFMRSNYSSPLFLACELGHEDIVRVLLSKNAHPTLTREDGKSPVLIAIQNGHMNITKIILNQNFS